MSSKMAWTSDGADAMMSFKGAYDACVLASALRGVFPVDFLILDFCLVLLLLLGRELVNVDTREVLVLGVGRVGRLGVRASKIETRGWG